ncbi:MAG: Phosphate regulon sensor protein PhoR [Myxococcaceae bacterium]|nr:Phosphate regulon sensor protein PhoR [Myxococcaceae bacterium]
MSKRRPELVYIILLPLLLAAAGVLTYYTWETASRYEELGASSLVHTTLLLVEEKVDRIEQQIISRDHAVFGLVDIGDPDALSDRFLPEAERIAPSVRAVLVMSEELEIIDYVSRAAQKEQPQFLRLFRKHIAPELEIEALSPEQLRHLHTTVNGTSYLISYQVITYEDQRYVVAAHHDTGFIVREEFPRLVGSDENGAYINVVDEDSHRIFGDSLAMVADYLAGMRFPTTLYRWRLQVAPKDAPLLKEQASRREFNKAAMIGLSVGILLVGVAFLLYAIIQERRLNALKSDFIANVSHELKTPLSAVRMFSEMLLTQRIANEDKRKQYLEIICREAERLSSLIENVLDFAALERGKQSYAPEEADLGEIVARAVETVRHRIEGIEIRVSGIDATPRVLVDAQAVLLATINLLDNALKYGEGTPIDVTVEVQRRELAISVRDRGPGIPRGDVKRVFDRFYRVRRPGQQQRGSGIGLSLVKHIADAHGGRAWADNAPDGGAIVSFSVARESRLRKSSRDAETRLPDPRESVSS